MRSNLLSVTVLAVLAISAHEAAAQSRPLSPITITRGSFSVQPFAGYLMSQSFVEGPLNTRIGSVNAPLYGVQASLPLAPSASLVGTIGYSDGDLEVGLPIVGGLSVGNSNAWIFDASAELRLDSWQDQGRRFVPFAQLGGGAIRREVTVAGISANSTDFIVSGGVGADVPLTSNMAIRLMAKDYYGKVDFGDLGSFEAKTNDFHTLGLSAGLRIAF
jgi:hypothetical protein